jgi:hypothetical protein
MREIMQAIVNDRSNEVEVVGSICAYQHPFFNPPPIATWHNRLNKRNGK